MSDGTNQDMTPLAPSAAPGWYRDPWGFGYRYWDGATWTAASFADVPPAGDPNPFARPAPAPTPPSLTETGVVPPPQWAWPPPADPFAAAPAATQMAPAASSPAGGRPGRKLVAIGLVAGLTGLAAGVAFETTHHSTRRAAVTPPSASGRPGATRPVVPPGPQTPLTPPSTAGPTDPASASLASVVLQQSDVAGDVTVATIPGGARVAGQTTLDVCNADYPSESLRTARLQVAARDPQGDGVVSTEAVLYQNPAATSQAFAELRAAASSCPATPVAGPNGSDPVITRFNPAPDTSWAATPGVDRLAFDMVATDASGEETHVIAVYLRRGRALLAVYMSDPQSVPAVTGTTDTGAIAGVFAGRLAALPASVVGA